MTQTTARIIDGKRMSTEIEDEVREEVSALVAAGKTPPCLVVVLVGEDPASQVYVRNKGLACGRVGFGSQTIRMPAETTEAELLAEIERLNQDPSVHGILVQLPVPKGIDDRRVIETISPAKDVDGFHPYNAGRLMQGNPTLVPATPSGVMEMLKRSGIEVKGAEVAIVGRSTIVGRPLAALMTNADATVTLCHSRTRNLAEVVRRADIVVAAVGKAGFVTADMVRPGATVIDVGINRLPTGKLAGDVAYEEVSETAGWITPVPGGVGPMTIALLLKNTLLAYKALAID